MYALLTKTSDGSFDLPVRWVGRSFNQSLFDLLGVTLSRDAIRNKETSVFGVFGFNEPQVPVGYVETTTRVDNFDGTSVVRKATWSTDPNYIPVNPKDNLVKAVKVEAAERILKVAPEWKQRNSSAEMAELSVKDSLSEDEQSVWNSHVAMWGSIKAIRSKSDEIEAVIVGLSDDEVSKFDVSEETLWNPPVAEEVVDEEVVAEEVVAEEVAS